MTERKLATFRRVAAVDPIPGADAIECLTVDGWKVVSQKGQGHEPGRLVLFLEIDSFLPVREEFEFLRKSSYKKLSDGTEGFRLRTIKLRGQVSQGLVVPIEEFFAPTADGHWALIDDLFPNEEGVDVTEALGVTKWDPPVGPQLSGVARGNFPSFIHKTDQERVQNCWNTLQRDHRDHLFEASIKLDGSSMTVYVRDGQFGVCSRNYDLERDMTSNFWQAARRTEVLADLVQWHVRTGANVAVQGELVGPGIQKNPEQLYEAEFHVFDVWDIDLQRYMTTTERVKFIQDADLQVKHVPVIGMERYLERFSTVDEILALADEVRSPSTKKPVEGVVFKSVEPGGPTFKVLANSYLLAEKD